MNIDTKQAFELGYHQGYANGKWDGDQMGYRVGKAQALHDAVKEIMSIPYTEIDNYPLVLLKEAIDAVNSLREGEDNETILREVEVQ